MDDVMKTYQGFYRFISEMKKLPEANNNQTPYSKNREAWYAYWDNNYVYDILNTRIVYNLLKKIADKYYNKQVDAIISRATELTSMTYPQSSSVFQLCCEILGMYNPPKIYITSKMRGINALSVEISSKQYIFISPSVTVRLTVEEQAFIFGHELGHHQQGNLVCHTVNGLLNSLNGMSDFLGQTIPDVINVPFKKWCRASEFNADRAGYLCCGNIEIIHDLLIKAMPYKEYSSIAKYNELAYTHPMLSARLNELNCYIKTLAQS